MSEFQEIHERGKDYKTSLKIKIIKNNPMMFFFIFLKKFRFFQQNDFRWGFMGVCSCFVFWEFCQNNIVFLSYFGRVAQKPWFL